MSKVLILTGRYLPGYKDGGPVRSIINLVNVFGKEYEINIVCLDRDHGDAEAYPDIKVNEYNRVGDANVYYATAESYNIGLIEKLSEGMDIVYSCGPYGSYARAAMKLNKQHKLNCPLVVASMGSFSPKALAIKGGKKKLFFTLIKFMGMFKNITWSVTSTREDEELKAVIGKDAKTVIAEDLPRTDILPHGKIKEPGHLDVIFLSRISRKKNLLTAANILKLLPINITCDFAVYGIMEDETYFRECEEVLKTLPENVRYEYKGEVDPEKVLETLSAYDVFLFPTLGENYGHVIAEAMAAGTVPVISDETPWMDLEDNNAGYALPLDDLKVFTDTLSKLASEDESAYRVRVENTKSYIERHNQKSIECSGYREIFGLNGK